MSRMMLSLGIVATLLITMVGSVVSTPVASATHADGTMIWRPCPTDALPTKECAALSVPLDYDEPDGAKISIAASRIPATDPAHRIGSLFLNPGGPGNSGLVALPLQVAAMPAAMRERFDVIGFDPRGVGSSDPVQCFATTSELTAFTSSLSSRWMVPANEADAAEGTAAIADVVKACGERSEAILPHLSTANVAHDLDRMRQAVGDALLNYLGTSYGTYFGETYANLYPDRIRAMVLDGAINPPSYTNFEHSDGDVVGSETNPFLRILSPRASSDALAEFLAQCSTAGAAACPFAESTAAATSAKFDMLMAGLRMTPMVVSGPAGTLTVTYSLVAFITFSSLYSTYDFPMLANALQILSQGDAAGFLAAVPGGLGGPTPTTYQNATEALWASACVDTDSPNDPAAYKAMAARAEAENPYFGTLWARYTVACATWPATDADRYQGPWNAETSATILIISRVFDPATPHGGAIQLEKTLANARLLTIDGWGHGYYLSGKSTCADDAMTAYFIDGHLTPAGTVCAEDALPFATT